MGAVAGRTLVTGEALSPDQELSVHSKWVKIAPEVIGTGSEWFDRVGNRLRTLDDLSREQRSPSGLIEDIEVVAFSVLIVELDRESSAGGGGHAVLVERIPRRVRGVRHGGNLQRGATRTARRRGARRRRKDAASRGGCCGGRN